MHGREPTSKVIGMYRAQHGDDTYQCSIRIYEACWSVYVVNWKLSYFDLKCKCPFAVWICSSSLSKKLIFPKSQCTVSTIYCVTLRPCVSFLCYFMFDSDLIPCRSNRKQSPQGSTQETKGNVTLWVISALFMNSAQSRVALNSLINWLF